MNTAPALAFDGSPDRAARINYSVPLPGSHTGRRILELDLGLEAKDWTALARSAGADVAKNLDLKKNADGSYSFDFGRAIQFWLDRAEAVGVSQDQLKTINFDLLAGHAGLLTSDSGGATRGSLNLKTNLNQGNSPPPPASSSANLTVLELELERFLDRLKQGEILHPGLNWAGTYNPRPVNPQAPARPALFIVEVYGISSFLGDYGLGRTVKTLTLLPGESTTISMRTWRATRESIARGSSIVDSHQQSAAERFSTSVQQETTDKATQSSTTHWHAEAEVSASWGWGKAKASGGGGGEYHAGREEFSRRLDDTVQEHANESSAARETTVTSSSERSEEREDETVIERTIKNVNMRRVLNFVFRELNQQYIVKTHLKDIRIAFTNGRVGTWREVPLSGLRGLLEEVLEPAKINDVAQQILRLINVVFDRNDEPVYTLETITMSADGQDWQRAEARLVGGQFPPPNDRMFYRFKRGPLAQAGEANLVDGVLMKESTVTMRTDSVIVEALLGQADALDAYAMEIQEAAAQKTTLRNERERIAQETLQEIDDPVERAKAYVAMFQPEEENK